MSHNILEVRGLGKSYCQWGGERRRIASWFIPFIRPLKEHWVLKDVSFTVKAGEAIGVIGQNGAGKSTLLKLVTGTATPTCGSVTLRGRVSAILELGMGFNLEMTGRQNASHSAVLMGFTPAEVNQAMPQIEAFADIGAYFDQPMRTYSSGMQMRVAFSVATAFRPDVLIVDEALSVGDAAFQRKCFRLIEDFVAQGTSLLFVSHDFETVRKICHRAIFLENGNVVALGDTKDVCDIYERHLFAARDNNRQATHIPQAAPDNIYGDGRAVIEKIWLENNDNQQASVITSGEQFSLNYSVRFIEAVQSPIFSMLIKTREGVALFGTDTSKTADAGRWYDAGTHLHVRFSLRNVLAAGTYYFNCGIRDDSGPESRFIHRLVDIGMIHVAGRQEKTVKVGLTDMSVDMVINPVVADEAVINEVTI